MKLGLSVVHGADRGRSYALRSGTTVAGSAPDVDLPLDDARVSRRHASFELVADGVRIRDLGSKNGTRLNGARVVEAVARPGALLELGDTTLVITAEGTPVTPARGRAELGGVPAFGSRMRRLFAVLERAARSDVTVLLEGESGVGKDVIARALHAESPRSLRPFVVVDCGSIAPALVASELFGHKRGAFTSASENRVGAFEAAGGGTLFIDEVGELPLDVQPALLRVLESRQVTRVGEGGARPVDVRVVAATNRRLRDEVDRGRFRADLFFRLAVIAVTIPPLRERADEVLPLAVGFLKEHGRNLDDVDDDDRRRLLSHKWPGNVRELRNLVARSCALGSLDEPLRLLFDDVGAARVDPSGRAPSTSAARDEDLLALPLAAARRELLDRFDARYLRAALEASGDNVSAAARKAGVARSYFHRMLQRHPGVRRK